MTCTDYNTENQNNEALVRIKQVAAQISSSEINQELNIQQRPQEAPKIATQPSLSHPPQDAEDMDNTDSTSICPYTYNWRIQRLKEPLDYNIMSRVWGEAHKNSVALYL